MPDTISAVSTPVGEGAIAVVRISGPRAFSVVDRVFRRRGGTKVRSRQVYYGELHDEHGKLDEVLVTYYQAPKSYTGENLVEVSCHGGLLITRKVLQALLHSGSRLAEPGEYTQRAFLNGKMDLTQAEAVMDMIRAQTDLALRAANEQLAGTLGVELNQRRDELLTLVAHVEAYIDFPDEDIDPATRESLSQRSERLETALGRLLATAAQGRILRHGLRTVIYGAPNVGKSSLLNLLLGYERAIVSDIPGTTRDTIEETINVSGLPVRLVDTAGTRKGPDRIEEEGIRRSEALREQGELVLWVVDASLPQTIAIEPSAKTLVILNKTDLGTHADWATYPGIPFSCRTRSGLEDLNRAIWEKAMGGAVSFADVRIAISARHQSHLERAVACLRNARQNLRRAESPEFIAIDLRESLDALGEILGRLDTEDLLGRIFSEFCIGK
jgi:tRNA modification GTPase